MTIDAPDDPGRDRPSRTLCSDCRHFDLATRQCLRVPGWMTLANRARLAGSCGERARHFEARTETARHRG